MLDVFIDSLLDSLKVVIIVLLFNILLSFFEAVLAEKLQKNKKVSPLLGAAFGLIPQCGFSIIASDMYLKQHITMGTLLAVFIACSDEALPILLSNPNKLSAVLPLIVIKFILGFLVGFSVDLLMSKAKHAVDEHHNHCSHVKEIHVGCCHHDIDNEKESKISHHLIHPLFHSLKIFGYIFIINFLFGTIIFLVGEDSIVSLLQKSRWFSPLIATMIGLIPNCASSVIITNLFLLDGISFGACLSGLIVNAGLGMIYLLKSKHNQKNTAIIFAILVSTALIAGYICEILSI